MTTAGQVAIELRKLADALDKEPEQVLFRPEVDFSCKYKGVADVAKPVFLALARILPHPLAKAVQSYDADALELRYTSDALIVTTAIERKKVCRLIEPERIIPAVYDCEPLLTDSQVEAL